MNSDIIIVETIKKKSKNKIYGRIVANQGYKELEVILPKIYKERVGLFYAVSYYRIANCVLDCSNSEIVNISFEEAENMYKENLRKNTELQIERFKNSRNKDKNSGALACLMLSSLIGYQRNMIGDMFGPVQKKNLVW